MYRIRYSICPIALILCAVANSAEAQSLGRSFSSEGRIALGFADQVPGRDIYLLGNATARVMLNNSPLGFELGVFGLANALDNTPHETYGTFTYDFGQNGRLFLGVPHPAYDSFAVSAVEAMFPALGVFNAGATRSQATDGAMFKGFLPYGIRFQAQTGQLRYAVSVETVPNRDAKIASVGFGLPIGALTFESAVEVSWGPATNVAGKVQIKGAVGLVNGGIGIYMPGTVDGAELLEAFAAFDPAEKITLSGVAQIPLGGGGDPTVGVSARYAVAPSLGLSAGAISQAGAEVAYSAFLDWTF